PPLAVIHPSRCSSRRDRLDFRRACPRSVPPPPRGREAQAGRPPPNPERTRSTRSTRVRRGMARKAKIKAPGSDTTPDRRNDAFPSGPSEAEYKVGPGRPPKEYQFKQGQSGNPKGRKRKAPSLLPDLKQLFESALNQKVKVTQGGGQRLLTMWDAGMQQLAVQFAKGDRHARRD